MGNRKNWLNFIAQHFVAVTIIACVIMVTLFLGLAKYYGSLGILALPLFYLGFIVMCTIAVLILMLGNLAKKHLEAIEEQLEAEEQLHRLARYDYLTNLPNRRLYDETFQHTLQRADRTGDTFALMMLDLDHFKAVNDNYGHTAGDLLLPEVANRLKDNLRAYDFLARVGGDEFAIILFDISNNHDLITIADKLIATINHPFSINKQQVNIGLSIGISFYPRDGQDGFTLMKHADKALYQAKSQGKNRFRVYTARR